ncbi:MAG: agmatine deiminase family protein [Candidatus Omnitrophota bacterium]
MITDQETNFLYFSELLSKRHSKLFQELKAILDLQGIKYGLLSDTNDIWCRDYMPVQVTKNEFVQFSYKPAYLMRYKKYRRIITDSVNTYKTIGINSKISPIKIDGGNIVKSRNKVIMTERIFSENRRHSKQSLLREIKKLLRVKQVITIPECPFDRYGHADGMIRFVDGVKDEETVLVNDFLGESAKFFSKFHRAILRQGLCPILLPYKAYRNKGDDAKGIYTNYLEIGKTVIYPIYGIKEDGLAHKVFSRCFGAHIFQIRADEIAREGGVFNCISWNIKKGDVKCRF